MFETVCSESKNYGYLVSRCATVLGPKNSGLVLPHQGGDNQSYMTWKSSSQIVTNNNCSPAQFGRPNFYNAQK